MQGSLLTKEEKLEKFLICFAFIFDTNSFRCVQIEYCIVHCKVFQILASCQPFKAIERYSLHIFLYEKHRRKNTHTTKYRRNNSGFYSSLGGLNRIYEKKSKKKKKRIGAFEVLLSYALLFALTSHRIN